MNPRRAVRAARLPMARADLLEQSVVRLRPGARAAPVPRMVPAGGDAQDAAHRGNRMGGLIRLHESEPFEGIDPVARANQAAAFFRISRSSRSVAFSRRRRCSSVRSSAVRPSVRRPAFRSACVTQLRQCLRRPAGADELHHLVPKRPRIGRPCPRHDVLRSTVRVAESTKPGQLQTPGPQPVARSS
jgi:hypothetical protein